MRDTQVERASAWHALSRPKSLVIRQSCTCLYADGAPNAFAFNTKLALRYKSSGRSGRGAARGEGVDAVSILVSLLVAMNWSHANTFV